MSRGIKDLRELVVVSRLSYRESDSESDDGRGGMITPFESLEIGERFSDIPGKFMTTGTRANSTNSSVSLVCVTFQSLPHLHLHRQQIVVLADDERRKRRNPRVTCHTRCLIL